MKEDKELGQEGTKTDAKPNELNRTKEQTIGTEI